MGMTNEELKDLKDKLYKVVEARLHKYKDLDREIFNMELEIEELKLEYTGCKGIKYSDNPSQSNSFNSIVENEILLKEKKIEDIKYNISKMKLEKMKIDNALTCLGGKEKDLFDLYYNSNVKNSITYITGELNYSERKTTYDMKDRIVYKMMDMLYPKLKEAELPLFNCKSSENTHFIHN